MDPLSITTGVLGLLGTCINVGSTLKAFYDGASFADTKVKGLLTDVESFTQVLQLMKNTFEQDQIQSSIETTSHISAHWVFLATSIQDGQNTLLHLQETLERVNKSVSVLAGARKHLRLKSASEEIGSYQLQIRSYRDSLQLSLQTMIFSNQVTLKESTDKVLPNLDEINQAIRRIALDLNDRMRSFQQGKAADPNDSQLLALKNLSNCVQSAATVVSSASTILGVEDDDQFSIINGSEFGDIFVSEPGETMRRWISSKTVSEFEEDRGGESSSKRHNATSNYLQQLDENTESDQSDSDTDLELEIVQALLKRGKERFEAKDLEASERLFRNCLSRLSSNVSTLSLHHIPKQKSEIIILLLDVYVAQEKWDDAQSLLLEKIAAGSRDNSGNNGTLLLDMLILVDVLIHKESYTEALLYGRRALRGYRKLGSNGLEGVESSLKSLMRVCHLNGNYDEEDAYAAILSDFLRRNVPYQKSLDTTQPNADLTQPPPVTFESPVAVIQGTIIHPSKPQSSLLHVEQHSGTTGDGDLVGDQSTSFENLAQSTENNRVLQPPPAASSPLSTLSNLEVASIEDERTEIPSHPGFVEPVLERMPSSNSERTDTKPVEIDSPLFPLDLTSNILGQTALGLSSDHRAASLRPSSSVNMYLDQPQPLPKSITTSTNTKHNAEYNPFRSFPSETSSSATTLVLGRDHSMSSLWPPGPKAIATDSTAITASKEKFSSYPLIASEVAEQDTQANVSSSAIVDFVIKAPPKPIEVHNKLLLTQNTIATSRGIPSPTVTPAEVQSALDPESRRISGVKMTTIDSNEQKAEGPVVYGTRDNSSLSSTSQPALVYWQRPKFYRKIVAVGDVACGKTSLIRAFTKGFGPVIINKVTASKNYFREVEVDSKRVELTLWVTGGSEDDDRLRPLSYPDSHVVLICFAVDSPDSLDDVQEKWISEVSYFCSRVPIILVGLKKDLRDDSKTIEELHKISQKPITYEQGAQVAKKIGAYKYLECSLLTREGVPEVFGHAIRAALLPRKKGFLKRERKKGEGSTGSFRRLFSRTSS